MEKNRSGMKSRRKGEYREGKGLEGEEMQGEVEVRSVADAQVD